MSGTLFVLATPIGNLEDITHRAVRVLGEVDLIACEDTRHTRKLLHHYGIGTPTISYHEHNERERAVELLAKLRAGLNLALVSDAGTPAISDPGLRLVRLSIDGGVKVVSVPGPSALVTALVASGLATDAFFFGGFLPPRSAARRARLAELASVPATLVFYEAPHRLAASLRDAHEVLGERQAALARELTKLHEEIIRDRLGALAERFKTTAARGEFVLLIDREAIKDERGSDQAETSVAAIVSMIEAQGLDHRAALKRAAQQLGLTRAEAYRRLVIEKERKDR